MIPFPYLSLQNKKTGLKSVVKFCFKREIAQDWSHKRIIFCGHHAPKTTLVPGNNNIHILKYFVLFGLSSSKSSLFTKCWKRFFLWSLDFGFLAQKIHCPAPSVCPQAVIFWGPTVNCTFVSSAELHYTWQEEIFHF